MRTDVNQHPSLATAEPAISEIAWRASNKANAQLWYAATHGVGMHALDNGVVRPTRSSAELCCPPRTRQCAGTGLTGHHVGYTLGTARDGAARQRERYRGHRVSRWGKDETAPSVEGAGAPTDIALGFVRRRGPYCSYSTASNARAGGGFA